MGIYYSGHLIYGLRLNEKDCYNLISPAKYDRQDRYDPKTGQFSHQENVLIEKEQEEYRFQDFRTESFDELQSAILDTIVGNEDIDCISGEDGYCVIGVLLIDNENCGRIDWPVDKKISFEELEQARDLTLEKLRSHLTLDASDLGLYFVMSVG